MKTNSSKRFVGLSLVVVTVLVAIVLGGSFYMLDYSLGYTAADRLSASEQRQRILHECPWTAGWMDSVYCHRAVRDTFVTMPSGYRGHAIYLFAPQATKRTAIVVHGYKVRAEGMLHIAYLYHHDMGYTSQLRGLSGKPNLR